MGVKTVILTLAIISLMHLPSNAQQSATAVMNLGVEIVSGSSVVISNFDIIATDDTSDNGDVYTVITITHNSDELILISFSDSISLINGEMSHNMESIMTESRENDSTIKFQFETSDSRSLKSGNFTGSQVAEIIYL